MPGRSTRDSTGEMAINSIEMEKSVIELRKAGMSHRGIAEHLDISRSTSCRVAQKALSKIVEETKPNARALRRWQAIEIMKAYKAIQAKVEKGSIDHINTALRLFKRQAELFGLDEVVKTKVDIDVNVTATRHNLDKLTDQELKRLHKLMEKTGQLVEDTDDVKIIEAEFEEIDIGTDDQV